MTQYDMVGGGPAGPEDDDYGPPDWFAAVAEPEPEPRARPERTPVRVARGAAPGPVLDREQPTEAPLEALGLVPASELRAGRRRRRSALAEESEAAGGGMPAERSPGGAEAAGHGGVAASPTRARRGRRSGRSEEGPPGEETGAARTSRKRAEEESDPESRARDICLRLLTGAAKSRKQLADALRKREIPEDVAEEVLTRLEEVGLIDDAAFAAAWVESRHAVRGLSRRALTQELRTKGVAADVVEQAVAQLDHDDETDAARALVERKLRSTRGLDPQVRTRRLVGMLARRGYSEGLAFRVVRGALEQEASGERSGTEWE
ncbi:recombination regulator RecX [Streptomyces viridifaciens]|uniref:recombination regulator RecX n=1 Tax=Kitasatospora aureofaciens TaxID=1894 RepID=UPI001CC79DB3|nr:recombination regulator RecX [Streptomyces viridifaciens]